MPHCEPEIILILLNTSCSYFNYVTDSTSLTLLSCNESLDQSVGCLNVNQFRPNFFWCLTRPLLVIFLLRQNLKQNFDLQWITLLTTPSSTKERGHLFGTSSIWMAMELDAPLWHLLDGDVTQICRAWRPLSLQRNEGTSWMARSLRYIEFADPYTYKETRAPLWQLLNLDGNRTRGTSLAPLRWRGPLYQFLDGEITQICSV